MSQRMVEMDEKIISLERQQNLLSQRMRENNIEFHGIDNSIADDDLEETVIDILNLLKIKKVGKGDIEGCHWLPLRENSSQKPLIVKFVNRKIPEMIMKRKSNLKGIDFTSIGLPENSEVYPNINLSRPFIILSYFCRKLKSEKIIQNYLISHSMIKIKINPDESYHKISHISDLKVLFPDFNFTIRLPKK